MKLFKLILFFCFPNIPFVTGQTASLGFIEFGYKRGQILQDLNFLKGSNRANRPITDINIFTLKYGIQTDGSKIWHQIYNFPSYGFGVFTGNFNYGEELGTPVGVYGFFQSSVLRLGNWNFKYGIELGLAGNWKPYEEESNPYNIAIGSSVAAYIGGSILIDYSLSDKFGIAGGVGFNHFSNGALKVPNWGLNTFSYNMGLQYDLRKRVSEFEEIAIPEYRPRNEFTLNLYAGIKQVELDTTLQRSGSIYHDVDYAVVNLKGEYLRQFSHTSKIGAGLDLAYDASTSVQLNHNVDNKAATESDNISLGIYAAYELVIDRFALLIHPGYYIVKKYTDTRMNRFYQRVGLKYYITDNLFIGVNVRAFDFTAADFTEWGLGYSASWY